METFELTDNHIKLASNMYISWDGGEYGAPAIDCKRPYGNSDVESDICEILGWFDYTNADEEEQEQFWDHEGRYGQMHMDADRIHREMQTALQIILTLTTFEPGTYERDNGWTRWRKA